MNITLNFGTEEEPRFITIEARTASMQAADDIQAANAKAIETGDKLEKELEKLSQVSLQTDSVKKAEKIAQKNKEYRELMFSILVETSKICVRRNNLTTEDKALFDQDSQSPFWRSQEVEVLTDFVKNFRAKLI